MPKDPRYLTAAEAAAVLGVTTATLYAYVSRGLLRSEPPSGGSRVRRYPLADVEALLARKEYRREPSQAAEAALSFGLPVLDSALTLIDDGRLYYRGHDVLDLAQARSFEEVCALLWTGALDPAGLFGGTLPSAPEPPISQEYPIERGQAVLAAAAAGDLAAHGRSPGAVARTGARILALLARAMAGAPAEGASPGGIAAALQVAWAPGEPAGEDLFSAALILCADHELNVSAFTARCVASAGASPYAVVIAALSALQGHRHGGHTVQVRALLAAAAADGVRAALGGYLRSGETLPGFGHPLYPDGDPRAGLLLRLLSARLPGAPAVRLAGDLCAAAYEHLGLRPTIDLALTVLAAAAGAPRHAPLALFALGRTAGWIGHAIEQYALDQLIRPRARYVGPAPTL